MDTENKKEYEIGYLAKTEEGVKDLLETIKKLGGEITFENPATKINLAYKIEKEQTAFFGYAYFTSSSADVKTIEAEIKMKGDVLRTLIITPPYARVKTKTTQARPRQGRPSPEAKTSNQPLSNEALEKKIEEILNK